MAQNPHIVYPTQLPHAPVDPPSPVDPQPNLGNLEVEPRQLTSIEIQQNFDHLNNGLQAILQGINRLIDFNRASAVTAEASFGRFPLQLCNTAASYNAPLRYPECMNLENVPAPLTKRELAAINDANVTATLLAMGIPIPAGADLRVKRQILMDFLGAAMVAGEAGAE